MIAKIILWLLVVALVLWVARKAWVLSAGRKRRELQELVRRRKEDAEREEIFAPARRAKVAEEYRRMQKLREEAKAPVLDLPEEDAPIQPAIPQDKIITDWKGRLAAVKDEEGK